MKIEFYPYCDKPGWLKATEEYKKIWEDDGYNIIIAIEEASGLKFQFQKLRAIVYEGICRSNPLSLRASLDIDDKKAVIIHELIHILLSNRSDRLLKEGDIKDSHQLVYLILYDIWVDLHGKEFADKQVKRESLFKDNRYKTSWEWTLSFDKEERIKKYKELTK